MRFLTILSGLFILSTFFGCKSHAPEADLQFNGMWRLEKIESLDKKSGEWTYDSTFTRWNGLIIYDGQGHMGVQITPKGYRDFKPSHDLDSLNPESLKELVKFYQSNWVYFADYKITNHTIEHKRLSATNPNDWGSSLFRDFEFRHDTLILTAHETVAGKKSRLWWVKL